MRALQGVAGALATVLAAAGLAACRGADSDSSAQTSKNHLATLTVAFIPIADFAPMYLGDRRQFFARRGIKLKFVPGTSDATAIPELLAGQIDVSTSSWGGYLVGVARGLPSLA